MVHGVNSATMMSMRVVIDTNVFLGACLGKGPASGVVAACLRGACTPLMGAALLAEYEAVMGREPLFAACRLSPAEREELLDAFFAVCEWTRIYYTWRPNLPDEADNHLVELAVAGGADAIVTRNLRHLRRMELRFPRLRILAPNELLREI